MPTVKPDIKKIRVNKFLVVEEKQILIRLEDLMLPTAQPKALLTEDELKLARQRLIPVACSTWRFAHIGDFSPSNVGYDGNEWFVFDMGHSNIAIANHRQRTNAFTTVDADFDLFHFDLL